MPKPAQGFAPITVALPNCLEKEKKATQATSDGQVETNISESLSILSIENNTDSEKYLVEYLSESVASVARVDFIEENRVVKESHTKAGCGSCGSSEQTIAGGPDQSCSPRPADGAALEQADVGGVPDEWVAGVASLSRMGAPVGLPPTDWIGFVHGATRLLVAWGAQMGALGWTASDLFAVHRTRPMDRYEHAGLVRFLERSDVVAVTGDSAVLRCHSGALQTFRRRPPSNDDWVMMWELDGYQRPI